MRVFETYVNSCFPKYIIFNQPEDTIAIHSSITDSGR